MTKPRKPRIVTEATKAKLPKPKRKRPPNSAPKRETWAEGYAKWEAKAERANRVQCPRCEKLVLAGPHDIHTCYDAKALLAAGARTGLSVGFRPRRTEWVTIGDKQIERFLEIELSEISIPPITEPYPWPVRVLNWLDDAPTAIRRWLARTLSALATAIKRLAYKVAP